MIKKHFTALLAVGTLFTGSLCSNESPALGAVNFATCIAESKFGKKEQENFENLRKQMTSLLETTDKELKEITGKLEDTTYLESLSPKAEEELKGKYQALQEDMNRYQNQFYQVIQHANYQMMQKMNTNIANASEKVAKQKKLDYVINREACFYINQDLDLTTAIIAEMDKTFEVENGKSDKKLSENDELDSSNEASAEKAG